MTVEEIIRIELHAAFVPNCPELTTAILAALHAAGYAVVPREPTEAMQIAGGAAHCRQIGCTTEFDDCSLCHGKATMWNGSTEDGDGCVNGSQAAYRAMIAAAEAGL